MLVIQEDLYTIQLKTIRKTVKEAFKYWYLFLDKLSISETKLLHKINNYFQQDKREVISLQTKGNIRK